MVSSALASACIVKLPSMSVTVPLVVPAIVTLAPMIGSAALSTTLPLTVINCAIAWSVAQMTTRSNDKKRLVIFRLIYDYY